MFVLDKRSRVIESLIQLTFQAAMNMSAKILSIDLKKVGITVISLHPGWVKTDGGSQNAEMTVEESIGYMIETMHKFTAEQSGAFLNFDGKPLPW